MNGLAMSASLETMLYSDLFLVEKNCWQACDIACSFAGRPRNIGMQGEKLLAGMRDCIPANNQGGRREAGNYSCIPFEFEEDGRLCPCAGVP